LDPSSVTPDHPKYNILASHVQLPLRESNLINVMLIQKPLSKKDVMEWLDTRSKNLEFTEHSLDDPLHAKVEE
jgi:hypothetical protein